MEHYPHPADEIFDAMYNSTGATMLMSECQDFEAELLSRGYELRPIKPMERKIKPAQTVGLEPSPLQANGARTCSVSSARRADAAAANTSQFAMRQPKENLK